MALIRHRISSRVIVRDNHGHFLLMNTLWDPDSNLEPQWVTPGGGVDEGETLVAAAKRELLEETGLDVPIHALGNLLVQLDFRQDWPSGDYETGVANIFTFGVAEQFQVDRSRWTQEEHRDILEVRWWGIQELVDSGVPLGPTGLLEILVGLNRDQ